MMTCVCVEESKQQLRSNTDGVGGPVQLTHEPLMPCVCAVLENRIHKCHDTRIASAFVR